MGKVNCIVCQKRCRGAVLKLEDRYLHTPCFKCHKCAKPLEEQNFHFRDGRLFCPEDYRQEYSIKCAACAQPLEGEVVTALGNTFHTFCLRCFSCNRNMAPGEKTVALNDRFYCEKCVPPQVPREDSFSTGPPSGQADRSPPDNASSTSPKTPSQTKKQKENQTKEPKSSSLPRRLGGIFRSKRFRSQNFRLGEEEGEEKGRDKKGEEAKTSVKRNGGGGGTGDGAVKAPLSNGTEALTVNVGDSDLQGGQDSSTLDKKFDPGQSPNFSYYSGDEGVVVSKNQEMQSTPLESYPVTSSVVGHGPSTMPYPLDPALTTPSLLNTLSGDNSTLLFGSVRRICPPGVDYGHQYPISYLRLAEQGHTAVTSSDLLSSLASATTTPGVIRRPPHHPAPPATSRLSRRDMPASRTLPVASEGVGGFSDHRYAPPVFGSMEEGGRPEKDRYTRYRQLSPTSPSLGRAVSSGRGVYVPPSFMVPKSHTYSSYSTPNVNSRRGIRVLAESMMRTPRVNRSMSPEAALSAQAEARRLAAYPGAKIPDANSEPAIDRYDWPAPPSPAVVMIDRRRERALKSATLTGTMKSDGSGSDTRTLSPGTGHSPSPETDVPTPTSPAETPVRSRGAHNGRNGRDGSTAGAGESALKSKINTLKRTTGNSGMSAAVAQYVEEEERRRRDNSPDLDPISASRAPNASFEPPYSTRFANHRFASSSRMTLRRDEALRGFEHSHRLLASSASLPRPGYTSGILCSRPVSLPRVANENATSATLPVVGSNGGAVSGGGGEGGVWTSAMSPSQRKIYAANVSRTLPVNGASSRPPDVGDGAYSLTTSGLSMDGIGGGGGANTTTTTTAAVTIPDTSYRSRSTTLMGGLPPPSVTGLRPVGRRSYHFIATGGEFVRGRPPLSPNGWRGHQPTSEQARGSAPSESDGAGEASITLLDDEYPDVQSWLKPIPAPSAHEQKVYTYEELKVSSGTKLKGIDSRRREDYLSEEDFEKIFKMSRTRFHRLPEWKQNDLKRRLDLY